MVLTTGEVKALSKPMQGEKALAAGLLYGCGLRVMECLRLRVKDVDLAGGVVHVPDGKGGKDRVVTFPAKLREAMDGPLARIRDRRAVLRRCRFFYL